MKRVLPFCLALFLFLTGCDLGGYKRSEGPSWLVPTATPIATQTPGPTATPSPTPSSLPMPLPTEAPLPTGVCTSLAESIKDQELTDWQRAYMALLEDQKYSAQYGLHDLDGDGCPELLLSHNDTSSWWDPITIEVYTCAEGTPSLAGNFQTFKNSSYDEGVYFCSDRHLLLCDTSEDSIITGKGGAWISLVGGTLKVEPASPENIPLLDREGSPSPVFDGATVPFHNVWGGNKDSARLFLLPILNAGPSSLPEVTEEEKDEAQVLLNDVVEGRERLYAVNRDRYGENGSWMYFQELRYSDLIISSRHNGFYLEETITQDLNGDGVEEWILFLQRSLSYGYSSTTIVLSYQDHVVYAYPLYCYGYYYPDQSGTFWMEGSNLVGERLYFDRDQCYSVDADIPKPVLLYKTHSQVYAEGIRRTTLDAQGLDLEIYFEVPVFSQKTEGYQKINRFFDRRESEFFSTDNNSLVRAWSSSLPPVGGGHYYVWTAEVTEQTDKLVSVNLWWSWQMGGVNDRGGEAYTFRTDTGEPLSITDLAEGTEEEIRGAILDALEQYEYFYEPEDVLANAREYPLEDFTIFLTPEGFVIHLARYELGRAGAESDMYLLVEGLSLQSRWQS